MHGSPGTCLNQVSLVIDKPKPRNAEAGENLKKAEFHFMVDLKTLIHETSVDPKLLQLKICLLKNGLKKGLLVRAKYANKHNGNFVRRCTPIERTLRELPLSLSSRVFKRLRINWKQLLIIHSQGVTIRNFQVVTKDHLKLRLHLILKLRDLVYLALSRCWTEWEFAQCHGFP